jgi:hypothetical protein
MVRRRKETAGLWPSVSLLCALFACLAATAHAAADDNLCRLWTAAAAQLNSVAPIWIDPVTRWDGITVQCDQRTVQFNHFVAGIPSDLRDGWQGRLRRTLEAGTCANTHLQDAFAAGWTIFGVITFEDSETVSLRLACDNNHSEAHGPP